MKKKPLKLPRERAFFKTVLFLALGLSMHSLLTSCVAQVRAPTKIKVLSLNPDEYIGSRVHLSGRVQGVGPAEAYLLVEDDTGRILVGTDQLPHKLGCASDSKIELVGTLRRLKSIPQPYFSMDSLIHCTP